MRETFTWQPSNPDGSLGPPGTYTAEREDVEWCRSLYRKAMTFEGPERARRIQEVRTLMDALALLPGTRIIDTPPVNDRSLTEEEAVRFAARLLDEAAAAEDAPEATVSPQETPSLFDQVDAWSGPAARKTDPQESHDAAALARTRTSRDRRLMLAAFRQLGRNATYREAAVLAAGEGADLGRIESLRRRGSDLNELGVIEQVGRSGNQGIFTLTDVGRRLAA